VRTLAEYHLVVDVVPRRPDGDIPQTPIPIAITGVSHTYFVTSFTLTVFVETGYCKGVCSASLEVDGSDILPFSVLLWIEEHSILPIDVFNPFPTEFDPCYHC